jgi:hypothetical protein
MMKVFSKIERLPEFEKDVRKLAKKFRTIEEDLETFTRAQLAGYHKIGLDSGGIYRIPELPSSAAVVYKAKKFACKSLPGTGCQSGMRVIYAYVEEADQIIFIQLYYKGRVKNEDRKRIVRFVRSL